MPLLSHESSIDLGSGASRGDLYFRYYVKKGDHAPDGPTVKPDSIKLVDNLTFRDAAGNPVVSLNHSGLSTSSDLLIDAVRPKVTGIAITSTPENGQSYEAGETISVTVSFDENMRALPTDGESLDCGTFTDALPSYASKSGRSPGSRIWRIYRGRT